jgi:hypothetical protein
MLSEKEKLCAVSAFENWKRICCIMTRLQLSAEIRFATAVRHAADRSTECTDQRSYLAMPQVPSASTRLRSPTPRKKKTAGEGQPHPPFN